MLTDIAILILAALLGNFAFSRCGLPGILGMIAAGAVLGPSGLDLLGAELLMLLDEFKALALIVILIRAGLGIRKQTLNRIGGPAVRMGFIPCVCEGIVVMAASRLILGFSFVEAGMLGFVIAAVSPAVVIPQMLDLKEGSLGNTNEVPTLILAGAAVDVVTAITIFGVFTGLASGGSSNWSAALISLPVGIALGALIGLSIGFLLVWFFKRYHLRDTKKVMLFLIIAVIFYEACESQPVQQWMPVASLLGIMMIGFVILEKHDVLANRLALKFQKIWVLAEILLFGYIGAEVQLEQLDPTLIGSGLIVLTLGLGGRSLGVALALVGSPLNPKERLFCIISYWPKATVQAAMGAVPLQLVLEGRTSRVTEENGQEILAIAVLAIVVAAPLGAIGVKVAGPRLLQRD